MSGNAAVSGRIADSDERRRRTVVISARLPAKQSQTGTTARPVASAVAPASAAFSLALFTG